MTARSRTLATRAAWLVAVACVGLAGACGSPAPLPGDAVVDAEDDADPRDTSDTQDASDAVEPDADVNDADVNDADVNDADVNDADASEVDARPTGPTWLPELESLQDYFALRVGSGDVKYLAWVAGAERTAPLLEDCAFQDMAQYEYHLHFLRSFEPWSDLTSQQYFALVLRAETRIWWGGGVRFNPQRAHPRTGELGVMLWTVYDEALTVAAVVAADAALAPCMPFVGEQRAFWPSSPAQQVFVQQHSDALDAAGIAVVTGAGR